MARRKPGPTADELRSEDGVPTWVREVGYSAIIRDRSWARPPGLDHVSAMHAEHMRRIEASQQWCTERGLSFCMTVRGWRLPSPQEVAAGLTKGPADL